MLYIISSIAVLALIFAIIKSILILKKPSGNEKMKELSKIIHHGAMTFLNKEYRILIIFVILVTAILWVFLQWQLALSFIIGAFFSALAGNIGMRIATKANAKTAEASRHSLNSGLNIAFSSGTVMGLSVVGLGLLGVTVLYMIFNDPNIIYGFGFGASSIALFARVGGGIYTKAADVGADLVGKVEKSIPED
ncbi:sodium/proton-translocating pyrophosphatase, partial [Candidatus Woesearchaeota archaeon]|nr:sodium/proton-translocating pyrophosphatase [Candidatus Woesearchaeota archaeon]